MIVNALLLAVLSASAQVPPVQGAPAKEPTLEERFEASAGWMKAGKAFAEASLLGKWEEKKTKTRKITFTDKTFDPVMNKNIFTATAKDGDRPEIDAAPFMVWLGGVITFVHLDSVASFNVFDRTEKDGKKFLESFHYGCRIEKGATLLCRRDRSKYEQKKELALLEHEVLWLELEKLP
jgi:hypothetical protein